MIPEKVVSLLEIIRAYAEAYAKAERALTLIMHTITEEQRLQHDIRENMIVLNRLRDHLIDLAKHCEHLPMTGIAVKRLLDTISFPENMAHWQATEMAIMTSISDIQTRITDELSLSLFFKLPIEREKYFDAPRTGWEDVLKRFPDAILDVEEMSRCFALSRYAASVFHSVAAIEVGLLHLGRFIGVNDPHSGWTAVTAKLQKIMDAKYDLLSPSEKQHRPFLEQMHAVTQALKSAWRNKISHAQGKLIVMTSEFSPDVAEEIMIASRSFMGRLSKEMPEGKL